MTSGSVALARRMTFDLRAVKLVLIGKKSNRLRDRANEQSNDGGFGFLFIFVTNSECMIKNEKVQYWVELSDYDIETARAMLQSSRYLYVGFMCHQTIEKILKGYFASVFDEIPPFTHNLAFLIERSKLDKELSEVQQTLVDELEPLNIEARYPQYKERLLKQLTKEKCLELINKTSELQQWIKRRLLEK